MTWVKHADSLSWSQGHSGKGYQLHDGTIKTWNVDPFNPIDQQDVHAQAGELSPIALNFEIDPDGGVVTAKPSPRVESIIEAQPGLYDAGQREVFEDDFDLNHFEPKQDPGGKPDFNFINSAVWHNPNAAPDLNARFPCPRCHEPSLDGIGHCGSCGYVIPGDGGEWEDMATIGPLEHGTYQPEELPALGPPHYGMALRPQDAQRYIDMYGPYLEHWTQAHKVPSILSQGIHPGTHPSSDNEFEENEEHWDEDRYETFDPAKGHTRRNWDGFIETRPGYTYLGTPEHMDPGNAPGSGHPSGKSPYEVPLRVDLRKLDHSKLEADEDAARELWPQWKEQERERMRQEGQEPDEWEPHDMLDPPDATYWDAESQGLGDWAEQAGLHNPQWTNDSLGHGTIAYDGHIPPEAISLHPDWMDKYPAEAGGGGSGQMSLFSALRQPPPMPSGWQNTPCPACGTNMDVIAQEPHPWNINREDLLYPMLPAHRCPKCQWPETKYPILQKPGDGTDPELQINGLMDMDTSWLGPIHQGKVSDAFWGDDLETCPFCGNLGKPYGHDHWSCQGCGNKFNLIDVMDRQETDQLNDLHAQPSEMSWDDPRNSSVAGQGRYTWASMTHFGDEEYRGLHTAPGPDYGWQIHDMENDMTPGDFYTSPQYYMYNDRQYDLESLAAIMRARGNPEAQVTIHRAGPKPEFNTGDWVTPSHSYAKQHAKDPTDSARDAKVWSARVPAHTLWTNGDDLNEFGYHGPPLQGQRFYNTRSNPEMRPGSEILREGATHVSDVEGYTNWHTFSVGVTMDNDSRLHAASRKIVAEGGGPDDLRAWALKAIIGPQNKAAIEDAQEWNDVPEHDRLDSNYENFKNKHGDDPKAMDVLHGFMGGPDVSDTTPDLIDPELVNWQELVDGIKGTRAEQDEHEQISQQLAQQGITFEYGAGNRPELSQMYDAWLKHHGAQAERDQYNIKKLTPIDQLNPDDFAGGAEGDFWQQYIAPNGGWNQPIKQHAEDAVVKVQNGTATPEQQSTMQQALAAQGHAPEQIAQIMQPMWEWDPRIEQYVPRNQTEEPPDPSLDQPSDFTLPPTWTARRSRLDRVWAAELHVGLEIPAEVRERIHTWAKEQNWPEGTELEEPGEYHITLMYAPDGHEEHKDADWLDHTKGVNVKVTGVDEFGDDDDDEKATVLRLDSAKAKALADDMQAEAEEHDLEISKFPGGYKPHITVAYGPGKPKRTKALSLEFRTGPSSVSPPREARNTLSANHSLSWRPREAGRGMVMPDGSVHTWPEDDGNHAQHEYALNQACQHSFLIRPTGEYYTHDIRTQGTPETHAAIQDADPRLRPIDTPPNIQQWWGRPLAKLADADHMLAPAVELREWLADFGSAQPEAPSIHHPTIEHTVLSPNVSPSNDLSYMPPDAIPNEYKQSTMTFPQEQRLWENVGAMGEQVGQLPNGYTVERHTDPNSIHGVGQFMHNCWQEKDPQRIAEEAEKGFIPHTLHDEHGLPRAAFYAVNNPRINGGQPTVTEIAGMRRDNPLPEHVQAISDWAAQSGHDIPGYELNRFGAKTADAPQTKTADSPITQADATNDALGKSPVLVPSRKGDPDYLEPAICPNCMQTHRPDEPCGNSSVTQYKRQERDWYNRDNNSQHSAPDGLTDHQGDLGSHMSGAYGIIASWVREAYDTYDPSQPMPKGLPRPIGETPAGQQAPVPWSQRDNEWGQINHDRQDQASRESLCLVCGQPVDRGQVFVEPGEAAALDHYQPHHLTGGGVLDAAPLHDRCATLTAAHCQAVKNGLASGLYVQRPYTNDRSGLVWDPHEEQWLPEGDVEPWEDGEEPEWDPARQPTAKTAGPDDTEGDWEDDGGSTRVASADPALTEIKESLAKLAGDIAQMQKPGPPPEGKKPRKLVINRDDAGRMASIEEA